MRVLRSTLEEQLQQNEQLQLELTEKRTQCEERKLSLTHLCCFDVELQHVVDDGATTCHNCYAKLVISLPTYRIIVITMMIVNDADAGADYHRPNQHQHHHSHQCDHNQSFTW